MTSDAERQPIELIDPSTVRHLDRRLEAIQRESRLPSVAAGIVPIFCDIHAHMSAYVLVFSHPYFAVTAADGGYTIGNIPPGTYTVLVWSELGTAAARRVSVADGVVAEADFHIGRDR